MYHEERGEMNAHFVPLFRISKVSMRADRGNLFPNGCAVMRTRPQRSDKVTECGQGAKHLLMRRFWDR